MSDDNGTPTGQQGTDTGTGGQDPTGTAPNTPPTPDTGQQPNNQPSEGDLASLPDWAQKAIKDARAEAAKSRTVAKQNAAEQARAELAQQIGQALGLVKDDTPPDPAQLTQQLAETQQKARQAGIELAAYKAAQAEGARADRLLNSRQFADRIAALDPDAPDFGEQIKAAIRAEVETDPELYRAAPQGPPRGGAEFTGPTGSQITPDQFAAMGYAERTRLYQTDPDTYRRLAGTQ